MTRPSVLSDPTASATPSGMETTWQAIRVFCAPVMTEPNHARRP